MNKKLLIVLAASTLFINSVLAQNRVLDVITLKSNKGVIKGFINEQVPGETIRIIPAGSMLKIDMNDLTGAPSKTSIKRDSVELELTVVNLKSGSNLEGIIIEQSPGKWFVIETDSSATPWLFRYDEIEKIGKETTIKNDNIFKACGVIDVLHLTNGTIEKGIIIEQTLGVSVKIKTLTNSVLVYDIADVISTNKEAYDQTYDIFKQSAFLDIINLKNGSSIKGIIMQQTPNQNIEIETVGNSRFVQEIADVVKIQKEKNPYKEQLADGTELAVIEPNFVGDCLWIKTIDSTAVVEKQQYTIGSKTPGIFILYGTEKSTTRFNQNKEVKFIVKVQNNNISPEEQIHILKTEYDKKLKKRIIDSRQYAFLSQLYDGAKAAACLKFEYKKVGTSSFEIKLKISEPGEYAIHTEGCDKSFSLFGIDPLKPGKE